MDTVIARKSLVGITYIIATVISVFMLIRAILNESKSVIIATAIFTAVCLVLSIQYLLIPSNIIRLTDDYNLILPKNAVIPLESVNEVSYSRAFAKGIQYSWGSITLCTRSGKYKFGFICDCESVADRLTRLANTAKRRNT